LRNRRSAVSDADDDAAWEEFHQAELEEARAYDGFMGLTPRETWEKQRKREREGRDKAELRQLRLQRERAKARRRTEDAATIGRPPKSLKITSVEKAVKRLKARMKVTRPGDRARNKSLTYEAIAAYASAGGGNKFKVSRDRVKEIEQLMGLGWDLRKSHPDFPAETGEVRLPTPRQAARLLRSG
jgi:hypothetical protein